VAVTRCYTGYAGLHNGRSCIAREVYRLDINCECLV